MQNYQLRFKTQDGGEVNISIPMNASFAEIDRIREFIKYIKKDMLRALRERKDS